MALGAIALGVGAGLQIYGQYRESKARSAAALRQAGFDEMRAVELLERTDINNSLLAVEESRAASQMRARGPRSADTLGALENLSRDVTKQIELNNRDSQFEASMIRLGADEKRSQAKDERRAFKFAAASTALQAGGNFANAVDT